MGPKTLDFNEGIIYDQDLADLFTDDQLENIDVEDEMDWSFIMLDDEGLVHDEEA